MSGGSALVTGAGRGAGQGIATVLAEQGFELYLCDIDAVGLESTAAAIREGGHACTTFICDVSEERQVEALFAEIAAARDQLDLLVNTVAWIDPLGPIADMPSEVWSKSFRTNLDSVFYCTRAALRLMIPLKQGSIINFSSINGTRGFPDRASYAATKAAIINFTQTTAMENRQYGIRANCIVPGGIEGERVRLLRERKRAAAYPAGREFNGPGQGESSELVDPLWLGRYVAFLASAEGRHINGQSLVVGAVPRSPLQAMFPDM